MATRTWIRAAARLIVTMVVACATGAHAATAISLDSEPGDYVGGGGRYTLTTADGTISATRSQYGPGVRVDYVGVGVWTLNFVGPDAAPFVPGNYEKASRAPFKAPNLPGLEVDGDFRGCNALTGRFTVREIEFGANDQVVK